MGVAPAKPQVAQIAPLGEDLFILLLANTCLGFVGIVGGCGYSPIWEMLVRGNCLLYLVLIFCIIGVIAFAVFNPAVLKQVKGSTLPGTKGQQRPISNDDGPSVPEKFVYNLRKNLFTPAEVCFYQALDAAIGGEYLIFAKVRVADVLQPQGGYDRSTWRRAFNKISAKHFDFVLCHKETLSLKCVIELDDSSHNRQDRAERDTFLNNAAQSAGLAIVHFPVRASYPSEHIRNKLSSVMDEVA